MTFVLQFEISADGKVAKAELQGVKKAVDQAGQSSDTLSRKGRAAAGGVRNLGNAADGAGAELKAMAAAEELAAIKAGSMGRQHRLASGSVANLTAQFNDIGTMLAAGQNPLQLALQQGTQITQVIGPMGATGAVRALGAGLMSMLSPINLITIGSIAAGAAMLNWLTGAGEAAVTLEDQIEAAEAAISSYTDKAEKAHLSTSKMLAEFGTADPALRQVLADMAAMEKVKAYKEIDKTSDSVRNLVLDLAFWDDRTSRSAAQDFLGLGNMTSNAREAGDQFARNLDLLSRSEDPATKLAAALDLREQLLAATGGVEKLNEEQERFYTGLAATIRDLILMGAKVEGAAGGAALATFRQMREELTQQATIQQLIAQYGRDSAEVERARLAQERERVQTEIEALQIAETAKQALMNLWDQANPGGEAFAKHLEKIKGILDKTIADQEKDRSNAEARLASLQEEAAIRAAIRQYGEDSLEVTRLRTAAERRVFGEYVEQLQISDDLKAALLEAWDNAKGVAGTDMVTGIAAARAEARAMADEIVRALGASQSLASQGANALEDAELRLQYVDDPVELARQMGIKRMQRTQGVRREGAEGGELAMLDAEARSYGNLMASIERTNQARLEELKTRRSASGAAAKSAKELDGLIEQKRRELEILREADPVQAELLRYRELMANGTARQRAELEELIAAEIRETEAAEASRASLQFWDQQLAGLITRSMSATDVLNNLASAMMQAALLGSGPLAGLFGTSGTSLLGAVFGIPAKAGGGPIHGPGGPRDDKVLMWGSNGEYMVNAEATARNRGLLEWINAGGTVTGFATGGPVGAAFTPAPISIMPNPPPSAPVGGTDAGGSSETVEITVNVQGARGNAEIQQMVSAGVQEGLSQYDRMVMPARVKEVIDDPRSAG